MNIPPLILAAHDFAVLNRSAIESNKCSCFSCCKSFERAEVIDWVACEGKQTALCPMCGVDAVIPFLVDQPVLEAMNEHWFGHLKVKEGSEEDE